MSETKTDLPLPIDARDLELEPVEIGSVSELTGAVEAHGEDDNIVWGQV